MANIIALVTGINRHAAPDGQFRIAGLAEVEGAPPDSQVSWEVFTSYGASVAVINVACVTAAVDAAVAAGFSVLPPDTKTLFGAAVLG